ncbi:MAG: hypothetical protein IKP62_07985 [Salinivirgaceae bacterium]|nr:hypothetical protein [Salinivirgaceae bacterium]
MKLTYKVLPLFLACLAVACTSESKRAKEQQLKSALTIDSSECEATVKKIFFNLPSPVEITQTLLKTEEPFNGDMLNSADNLEKYNTSSSLALNFGIYGADLCYCRVYDQLQEAINYLSVIKKVTEKLQIPEEEGSETINRIEQSLENRDSIFYIISDTYARADSYLKENERDMTASLILAGAWIEGMYFATTLAAQPDAKDDIINNIVDQKYTVANLVNLLNTYNETPEVSSLIDDFNKVQDIYNSIEVTYDKSVVVNTDQEDHVTSIDAPVTVNMTKEQLKEIADLIKGIRSKIIG